MAGEKKGVAPTTFIEGMQSVVQMLAATMTAPDSAPHIPLLQQLTAACVGAIQQKNPQAQGQPPGAAQPPGPGGAMSPGGGTNIASLMGGSPQGPSAATSGGGPSPSGISSDDMRRAVAAQAGTAA